MPGRAATEPLDPWPKQRNALNAGHGRPALPTEAAGADTMLMVAQFCRCYPGLYVSPAWPTSDHIVPWRLFDLLYEKLEDVIGL